MPLAIERFLLRNPEEFSLREKRALSGKWVALARYTPANLALRRIAAIGDSPDECWKQLRAAGEDPADFECTLFR